MFRKTGRELLVFANVFAIVVLISFILSTVYIFGLSVYNSNRTYAEIAPIDYSEIIVRGGKFHVMWESKRAAKSCNVTATRIVKSTAEAADEYRVVTVRKHLPENSPPTVRVYVSIDVPRHVPPGEYMYATEVFYYCNLAHYIFGPTLRYLPEIPFKVIETPS